MLEVKNLPANTGDIRNAGSTPGSGSSPGRKHGNPFQYSCLENPMDRGTWWATVHEVGKSQTRLKRLNTYIQMTLTPLEALLSCFQPLGRSLTTSWWAWVTGVWSGFQGWARMTPWLLLKVLSFWSGPRAAESSARDRNEKGHIQVVGCCFHVFLC